MGFGAVVEHHVREHAEHGDPETERGVVHGLGNAVRQHGLLVDWDSPAAAMAPNTEIRPLTVPSSPIRVAMFARDHSEPTRFSACGLSSASRSLSAASISSGSCWHG